MAIKKIIFIIPLILVSSFCNVKGTQIELRELERMLISMKQIREYVDRSVEEASISTPTVLIGTTGAGKTTIFNLLLDIPLCARSGSTLANPVVIDLVDSHRQPCYKISENPIAETSSPVFKNGHYDLPGFNDKRAIGTAEKGLASISIQEIVNAYGINKVLKSIHPVKVLAVVNYDHLCNKMTEFSDFLNQFGAIFKHHSNELSNSLGLVITKFPKKWTDRTAQKKLKDTFNVYQKPEINKHLSEDQKFSLAKLISLENSKIAFFHEPDLDTLSTALDDLTTIPMDFSGDCRAIREVIENTQPVRLYNPCISFSENAIKRIYRMLSTFDSSMRCIIDGFYDDAPTYVQSLIFQSYGISKLRQSFVDVVNLLKCLSLESQHYVQNVDHLLQIFQIMYYDKEKISKLERLKLFLEFFDIIDFQDKIDPLVWGKFSSSFINLIQKFGTPPDSVVESGVLSVNGFVVSVGEICQRYRIAELSKIDVYALHSIFIDHEITIPSGMVKFLSPYCIIQSEKNVIVNLSGQHGESYYEQAEVDTPGQFGGSGERGGYFYGRFNKVHGSSYLDINANGGNGGKGQSGGNGSHGIAGDRQNLQRIDSKYLRVRTKLEKSFIPTNARYKEIYVSGTEGKPGQNGGHGGHKGYAGLISIYQNEYHPHIRYEMNDGVNGLPGEGGTGGLHGGETAEIYKRTYRVEYIFPEWWGIPELEDNFIVDLPVIENVGDVAWSDRLYRGLKKGLEVVGGYFTITVKGVTIAGVTSIVLPHMNFSTTVSALSFVTVMSPFYSKWCFSEWEGVAERVRYPTRANPGLQGSINRSVA